ncbi:MAG: DUF2079 domain-containing protein [Bacteroidetes bacterium]|nr:DUF2079 domain-containing protein [Bacteroidota bacterium]
MDKSFIYFYLIGSFLTLSIGFVVYHISLRYNLKRFTWLMYLLIFSSIYMVIAQVLKYYSLHFYIDFSHWTAILHNIVTSGKPTNLSVELMVPGGLNYFSVHFVPFLYVLAVPFKLWPYSETLIIMNYLVMASSIIPLYKLALSCHKDKKARFGLFVAALLLWYPTFQYTVLYEFEVLRFSIPIILWMLYFWEKKNTVLYFLFALLAVLVREEVGLTIMMFGVYVFLFEKRRLVGGMTIFIGLAAFIIITQIVMPFFRTEANYEYVAASSFSAFGNTPAEVAKTIISHPWQLFSTIFQPIKVANLFMLFLPLLFISLLAPLILTSTLANFGILLLSSSVTHCSYMLYYVSPSIPFIFYAFIKGWPRLLNILENLNNQGLHNRKGNVDSAAMLSVLCGMLVANVFFGPSPISLQFWFRYLKPAPFKTQNFHASVYKITDHHRKVEEFTKLIPDSAIISAEHFFAPRLFKKKGIMRFPQLESLDPYFKADYVLIDKKNPVKTRGSLRDNPQYYYDFVEKDPNNWELVKSEDGYFLFQRIEYPDSQVNQQ